MTRIAAAKDDINLLLEFQSEFQWAQIISLQDLRNHLDNSSRFSGTCELVDPREFVKDFNYHIRSGDDPAVEEFNDEFLQSFLERVWSVAGDIEHFTAKTKYLEHECCALASLINYTMDDNRSVFEEMLDELDVNLEEMDNTESEMQQ